jgi:hypothetical protein
VRSRRRSSRATPVILKPSMHRQVWTEFCDAKAHRVDSAAAFSDLWGRLSNPTCFGFRDRCDAPARRRWEPPAFTESRGNDCSGRADIIVKRRRCAHGYVHNMLIRDKSARKLSHKVYHFGLSAARVGREQAEWRPQCGASRYTFQVHLGTQLARSDNCALEGILGWTTQSITLRPSDWR